ncbi:unnamed protein product [Gadus morhua 'NCC']
MNTLNALFSDSRGLLYRHATLVSGTELRTRLGSPPPALRLRLLSDAPSITPAALGAGWNECSSPPDSEHMAELIPVNPSSRVFKKIVCQASCQQHLGPSCGLRAPHNHPTIDI